MISTASKQKSTRQASAGLAAAFNSVEMAVTLISLTAITVLIGAWCPQEAQVGQEKVVEQFGPETALWLSKLGITDIFHTPWFLMLIALLTVNLVVVSFRRVFPRLAQLKEPLPFLSGNGIIKLPEHRQAVVSGNPVEAINILQDLLRREGYSVTVRDKQLTATWGKSGRLAPTVTHIGLLTLLVGVTITSWTGFSGFKPIALGGSLSFNDSEHSRLWIGKLPEWRVKVEGTRREDYPSGEPKQWYSDLSVIDRNGKIVKKQQIFVNTPLTYKGVDIYQSSWGLDSLFVKFNGHSRRLDLRQMGRVYAAFLPLDAGTILIFSIRDQIKPMKLFAKTEEWKGPRLIAEIPVGESIRLGSVDLTYEKLVPVTGLQYKSDPGLPITYVAFGLIMTGVLLASVPYRQVWAEVATESLNKEEGSEHEPVDNCKVTFGGRSAKAKTAFARSLDKLAKGLESRRRKHA